MAKTMMEATLTEKSLEAETVMWRDAPPASFCISASFDPKFEGFKEVLSGSFSGMGNSWRSFRHFLWMSRTTEEIENPRCRRKVRGGTSEKLLRSSLLDFSLCQPILLLAEAMLATSMLPTASIRGRKRRSTKKLTMWRIFLEYQICNMFTDLFLHKSSS